MNISIVVREFDECYAKHIGSVARVTEEVSRCSRRKNGEVGLLHVTIKHATNLVDATTIPKRVLCVHIAYDYEPITTVH